MHSQLEQYLRQVAERLGPLPMARRNEELREMRQHLLNAVIVNEEMGQAEDEAAATAVEQFGPPRELGESLVEAWRRGRARERRGLLGASSLTFAFLILFGFFLRPIVSDVFPEGRFESPIQDWYRMLLRLLPSYVLAGIASGLLWPRRAVVGAATAVVLRTVYVMVRCHIGLMPIQTAPVPAHEIGHTLSGPVMLLTQTSITLGGIGLGLLSLTTLLAAWAASQWQNTRTYPMTATM